MKKSVKRIALVVTGLTLTLGMSMSVMAAKNEKNQCGKNATFDYDKKTKTLTIRGKGTVDGSSEWEELKLKKVIIKDGITAIDEYTFSDVGEIKTVELPKSLKSIGKYAFEYSKIKKIKIPKSVKRIGSRAFYATNLQEVTIPKKVKFMGEGVFGDCKKLKKVEWNYYDIPDKTFKGCTKLQKVSLKSKIGTIGESAFCNTTALKQLTIPNGLKLIGKKAFTNSGIETMILPNSVTQLKPHAFNGAKQLKKLTLSNGMKRIEHDTFRNCVNLEQVQFGTNLELIGEEAFIKCKLTNLVIPATVNTVEYGAFRDTKCQTVTIQEGTRIVDYWAFASCPELKSISIPSTVSIFRTNALSNCPKLATITVNEKNGKYAVDDNCLTSKDGKNLLVVPGAKTGVFELPEAVTNIDQEAFTGCTKITAFATSKNQNFIAQNGLLCSKDGSKLVAAPQNISGTLTIPEGTKTIGAGAVHYSKASRIVIPNTVTIIEPCAFEYCNNIVEMTIPGSVYQIPEAAFWECANLRTVTLEEGISRIWRNGFYGCKQLKKITLPKSLSYIHKTAFEECAYGFKIYCNKNSLAMAYATKYYFSYRII